MKKIAAAGMALFFALSIWAAVPTGQAQQATAAKDTTAKETKATHLYVGVQKCGMCHKSEARGNQLGHWKETKHSEAYATLAGDAAKAIGKKTGIDDPQKDPKCLKCHVTAYGAAKELLDVKYSMDEGVTCEACHGPGSDYMKLGIMKDKEKAIAAGLVIPTKDLCVKCHNEESPSYVKFNFEEMYAKIAHPVPKAEEKKPAQE